MSNQYDVFISYRHTERDRAWAKWLLESLETYKVPKNLQQRGFPARIGKAFRDEDELPTSADLSTNIQQALENSKYLVVICSKDTPSSLWVDKEVQTYRKLGKGDHIIPVLVDGTPETTFPPALITLKKPVKQADGTVIESNEPLEPIAADVRERKDENLSTLRRLALLRILAAILGCAFDDLRQRDHQREMKKKRIKYSIAAGILLILSMSLLYIWDYNRLKMAFYDTIVFRYGVPEGIGKLSKEEICHKEYHYLVETRKRKVVRVLHRNSTFTKRPATIDEFPFAELGMNYSADGKVKNMIVINEKGKTTAVYKYEFITNDSLIIDLFSKKMTPKVIMQEDNANIPDINRLIITLDDRGYPKRKMYQNMYGYPRPRSDGSYGRLFQNNTSGLPLREAALGITGEPWQGNDGFVWVVHEYDERSRNIKKSFLDLNDRTIKNMSGVHVFRFEYDAWGNVIRTYRLDENGEKTNDNKGVSEFMEFYNQAGFKVKKLWLDKDGKIALSKSGHGGVKYENNDKGLRTSFAGIGKNEERVMIRSGELKFSKFLSKYDGDGNVIETSYWDEKDKPCLGYFGVHRNQFKYDSLGNQIEDAAYGVRDEPIFTKELNGHKYAKTYDDKGDIIEIENYDVDENLCKPGRSWARYRCKRDERGNVFEESFYDPNNQRMLSTDGHSILKYSYDIYGNIIEQAAFGVNEEPVINNDGHHKVENTYDNRGNMVKEKHFDTNYRPMVNKKEGFCSKEMRYNPYCKLTDEYYYNTRGKPMANKSGYAHKHLVYDDKLNAVDSLFYGINGTSINNK